MKYKSNKGILYGYSQKSLDSMVKAVYFMGIVMLLFLIFLIWITYYVMKYDVVGNIMRMI